MWVRGVWVRGVCCGLFLLMTHAGSAAEPAIPAVDGGGKPALPREVSPRSLTLHERLQAYADLGFNLVYSLQQVRGIRIRVAPVDPVRPLETQLRADLQGTGLTLQRVTELSGYLIAGGGSRHREKTSDDPARLPAAALPVEMMEEVVVTSPRIRLSRNRQGGTRIPLEELEAYPVPGRDVLRAVASQPGNLPTGTGARQHTRGGNTDEVLYRLNGLRLYEPFHLRDFESLFSTLNPAVVDTVDLYGSGYPVAQGSRLAGIVDITLRSPEAAFEGEVDVNLLTAAAAAGGRSSTDTGGEHSWLASVRRSTVDLLLGSGEHDYGRPRFNDLLLHGDREWAEGSAAFGVLSTNDELDLSDRQTGETANADFHARSVWLTGAWNVSAAVAMEIKLLYSDIANERTGVLDQRLDARGFLDDAREFRFWSGGVSVSWLLRDGWLLRSGLEASRQRGEFDVNLRTDYGVLAVPLQPDSFQARQAQGRRSGEVFAGYVSLARTVTEGLDVELGLRQDFQDIDPVHARVVSPRVQINWHDDRWSVYLHAGRYAQLQELPDIELDDGQFELAPVQRLMHYSAGLSYDAAADWSAGIDVWCRLSGSPVERFENIYNRLVLLPELHADRLRIAPDASRACGLDTRLEWSMTPNGTLRASWTRAFTEERIAGHWRYRQWDVKHLVRIGFSHESPRWSLRTGLTWHSGWPRGGNRGGNGGGNSGASLPAPATAVGPLPDDDGRYSPFFTLDLHAGRLFTVGRSSIELYLDIANVLDRENDGGTVFREENGVLSARSRQLLPVIPNAGVRVVW